MAYLLVGLIVAMATAISAYVATSSLLLAFFAYYAAGTLTLLSALIAAGLVTEDATD